MKAYGKHIIEKEKTREGEEIGLGSDHGARGKTLVSPLRSWKGAGGSFLAIISFSATSKRKFPPRHKEPV